MRNILLTATLIFSCSQIAYADTAYFPAYPVPIPCAQGGTGLTSGTTNNVLAFTGSCTIGGTATPTISGTNITSATIPNAALVSTPDLTTCGTWMPTDNSGASLTFTVTSATYCHTNHGDGTHSAVVQGDITYPVTADASAAQLGGVPYASPPKAVCSLGFNSRPTAVYTYISGGSTVILFAQDPSSAGAVTNVTLSTGHFVFTCSYQSTS